MSNIGTAAPFVGSRLYNIEINSYSTGAVSETADFYSKVNEEVAFQKKLWCCILKEKKK